MKDTWIDFKKEQPKGYDQHQMYLTRTEHNGIEQFTKTWYHDHWKAQGVTHFQPIVGPEK